MLQVCHVLRQVCSLAVVRPEGRDPGLRQQIRQFTDVCEQVRRP
jgi:hypothetical protein